METALKDENNMAMQAKALDHLMKGQSLTGKGGAFAPLLKRKPLGMSVLRERI